MQLHLVRFRAMGSPCSVRLYASSDIEAQSLAAPAIQEVARLEAAYSRYRPESLLSTINASAGSDAIALDDETSALIDYAFKAWQESDGLFDITSGVLRNAWDFRSNQLPKTQDIERLMPLIGMEKLEWQKPRLRLPIKGMELDFGGCVKEYAADSAVAALKNQGVESAVVELGGDIAVAGPMADGRPWRLGVRDPFGSAMGSLAQLGLAEGAMASSGDYERTLVVAGKRYSHILNPLTGWPTEPPASVSVVASTCLVAGTVSTVAMLKGQSGCVEWLESVGLPFCVVQQNGDLLNCF